MNNKIRITKIQRMCFHDGPGIRTTIFLKGCSIRCPWCSNPENISFKIEEFDINGERGTYGIDYTAEELAEEIIKDKIFYDSQGGVTFSGGEALLQTEHLLPLIRILKKEKISILAETCLFVNPILVEKAAELIDYFIVDVKILDSLKSKKILGMETNTFKKNVEFLYQKDKIFMFRVPLCYGYTYTFQNINLLKEFFCKYKQVPVEIFSIHKLGELKYSSLGKKFVNFKEVSEEDLVILNKEFRDCSIRSKIISF